MVPVGVRRVVGGGRRVSFLDVTELELGGPRARVWAGESVAEVNERVMLFVRRDGYQECDSPAANAVPLTARWAGAAHRL